MLSSEKEEILCNKYQWVSKKTLLKVFADAVSFLFKKKNLAIAL